MEKRWERARQRAIAAGLPDQVWYDYALKAWRCPASDGKTHPYRLRVGEHGEIDCTCRAGFEGVPCKHVAAVTIHYEQLTTAVA